MGVWKHRLSNVDPINRMATCAHCGTVRIRRQSYNRGWRCVTGNRQWANNSWLELREDVSYREHKQDRCSRCGFIPEHMAQLDVHHGDGNRNNNDPGNLVTLCANCHRLIHHLKKL